MIGAFVLKNLFEIIGLLIGLGASATFFALGVRQNRAAGRKIDRLLSIAVETNRALLTTRSFEMVKANKGLVYAEQSRPAIEATVATVIQSLPIPPGVASTFVWSGPNIDWMNE